MSKTSLASAIILLSVFSASLVVANSKVQENKKVVTATATSSIPLGTNSVDDPFEPVDDMHHFMEYVCEPSYKGLKQILASEPDNRQLWKAFKNHALVLAETSALVAERGPKEEDKSKQWREISLAVYQNGKSLYKSAGKYDEAKKHYGLMIDQCNKCHTVFAKGKHQLEK